MAERSGMGVTADVLRTTGIADLARMEGFDLVVLDDLDDMMYWDRQGDVEGFQWANGFLFPKVFSEADAIVSTCCLKLKISSIALGRYRASVPPECCES